MKFKYPKLGIALFGVILISFLSGCFKDKFQLSKMSSDITRSMAVPIIDVSLNVYKLLSYADTSDLVNIGSTGKLALRYEGELFSFAADSIIELPDQDTSFTYQIDVPGSDSLNVGAGMQVTFGDTVDFGFDAVAGMEIDSILLKDGTFDLGLSHTFSHDVALSLEMPGLRNRITGQSFSINLNAPASSPNDNQSIDLSDYTFDLTDGGTTFNQLSMGFSATITSTGAGTNSSDAITISIGLNDLAFESVFGYFGQPNFSTNLDTIDIRLFKNSVSGFFKLVDPSIKIIVDNSFGFPVDIDFTTFESISTLTTGTVITPVEFGTPQSAPPYTFLQIAAPNLANIGTFVTSEAEMNSANSNVAVLTESTPKVITHQVQATGNPDGPPATTNFVTDQSRLKIRTEVNLPLDGYTYGWGLIDTMEVDLNVNAMFDGKNVDHVILRIQIENGFPFNANLDLKVMDENYNVTETLVSEESNFISSGLVDETGKVIENTIVLTTIDCDEACIQNLNEGAFLYMRVTGETLEGDAEPPVNVVIYDDYTFGLKVGIDLTGNVP